MLRRALLASVCAGCVVVAAQQPPPAGPPPQAPPSTPQAPTQLVMTLADGSNHPRVGVQNFQTGDATLTAAATTVADVLWADLDFEREFSMIPRTLSAPIPVAATPDALPYDRWRQLGTEYVVMGAIRANGQTFIVDFKLISVRPDSAGNQVWASTYEGCTIKNPRYCAHSIADDVHKNLRRLDGVARTQLTFSSDRDGARMSGRPTTDAGTGQEIYIGDYDGANQRRVTYNASLNITPAWSPTRGLLAYTSYSSGMPDIYIANLLTPGKLLRPAQGSDRVKNYTPAWSPDGTKIAFMSSRDDNGFFDIYVANADGSDMRNLTNTPRISELCPTWSPNGAQIAFASDQGTNTPQLYWIGLNGTGRERLTTQRADRPTWSPLGFIAFTSGGGAGSDIAIFDVPTKTVTVLTDGTGSNESPAVSPTGRHIAFVTTRWGKQQIAVMDRDGRNIRRITESGNNKFPHWQPIPR
jgi:TolB protein